MESDVRQARLERLHDWFRLQLDFAQAFATKTELSLDAAVTFYTSLHRRFGFGRPVKRGFNTSLMSAKRQ